MKPQVWLLFKWFVLLTRAISAIMGCAAEADAEACFAHCLGSYKTAGAVQMNAVVVRDLGQVCYLAQHAFDVTV